MSMQQLLYGLMLLLSGAIIMSALARFKMKVARYFFVAMLTVLMLYIPFYFGESATVNFFAFVFRDKEVANTFVIYMQSVLTAPFFLFGSMSLGIAVFSVLVLAAILIATVSITVEVVRFVSRRRKDISRRPKDAKAILFGIAVYISDFRFLYKRLERYRN